MYLAQESHVMLINSIKPEYITSYHSKLYLYFAYGMILRGFATVGFRNAREAVCVGTELTTRSSRKLDENDRSPAEA